MSESASMSAGSVGHRTEATRGKSVSFLRYGHGRHPQSACTSSSVAGGRSRVRSKGSPAGPYPDPGTSGGSGGSGGGGGRRFGGGRLICGGFGGGDDCAGGLDCSCR